MGISLRCSSYNVTGVTGKMKLNISSLPEGMYILELKSPGNTKTVKVLKME